MKLFRRFAFLSVAAPIAACNSTVPEPVALLAPSREPLLAPARVVPGRLEYAQEPDTFAPVLARQAPYPTQDQANNAFRRDYLVTLDPARSSPDDRKAVRVQVFACAPGTLNDTTGRIEPPQGEAIHCATDFYNASDLRLSRETVNYYYYAGAWHMRPTDPPHAAAPWINPEASPTDNFAWLPFGRRTTPYKN
ncbi:hypothetical protein IY145_23580 [Methylosinus sp. H3A]|uniref:hypothetical protein n=1 Tax=Methylosinus sp. H3A TaxID=2785786 RepID=UPI0018C2E465|nr:hypothetical protein [Methylosinus sp. H3A]MBG0812331.1 hypothetical protein [Methylosinus sp. H3A]